MRLLVHALSTLASKDQSPVARHSGFLEFQKECYLIVVPLYLPLPWTTVTFAFVRDNHIGYLWLNPGRISTSSFNWVDELGAIWETSLQSPICGAWGRWGQAATSSSTRTRSPLAWHSCLRSSRRNVASTWWACICHYLGLRWPVGILEE